MSKTKIEYKDTGWREIRSKLAKLAGATVKAGVVGTAAAQQHNEDEVTVGEMAIIHEMGTSRIPARPFIGPAITENHREFTNVARKATQSVIHGGNVITALNSMGEWAAKKMRERVLSNIEPPLAEVTVREKGHDHALIDTDLMYDSIGYEIVIGSEGPVDDVLQSLHGESSYGMPDGSTVTSKTRR